MRSLPGREEEGLVLVDGAAELRAELIALKNGDSGGEERPGIEDVVADKFVQVAVDCVRSGLGYRADRCRRFPAKFRRIQRLLNVEFLYRIDRRLGQRRCRGRLPVAMICMHLK